VLKGRFALDLRLGTRARPTKDLDLARGDAVEQATADLLTAQAMDTEDYFAFAVGGPFRCCPAPPAPPRPAPPVAQLPTPVGSVPTSNTVFGTRQLPLSLYAVYNAV
jgi:hypothetical protein